MITAQGKTMGHDLLDLDWRYYKNPLTIFEK
jgi:hypothetical protein